jgi:hypothetical protein
MVAPSSQWHGLAPASSTSPRLAVARGFRMEHMSPQEVKRRMQVLHEDIIGRLTLIQERAHGRKRTAARTPRSRKR